eukprot:362471-Chlamydomonas_euryale.AAC.3
MSFSPRLKPRRHRRARAPAFATLPAGRPATTGRRRRLRRHPRPGVGGAKTSDHQPRAHMSSQAAAAEAATAAVAAETSMASPFLRTPPPPLSAGLAFLHPVGERAPSPLPGLPKPRAQ